MQDYIPRRIDINGVIDTVTVKQFDNDSRLLEVTISDTDLADDSGNAFDLAECSAALYIQPEGNDDPAAVSFLSGTVESAESAVLGSDSRLELLKKLHELPEPYREVMYLRVFGNLSFAELGTILGKTENWARVTFYRGKEKLRKEVENDE